MRLFVSLELPEKIKTQIKKIQNLIKEKNLFYGNYTEKENLHLTLKFLGEINKEEIEKIKRRLKEINFKEFECEISEVGVFSKDFIKIIWVKLNGAEKLQKKVDESLKDLFKIEERFMSHITIARVKNIKDKKELLNYLDKVKIPNLKFKVNKFFLKKSELMDKPVYTSLEEYEKNIN